MRFLREVLVSVIPLVMMLVPVGMLVYAMVDPTRKTRKAMVWIEREDLCHMLFAVCLRVAIAWFLRTGRRP